MTPRLLFRQIQAGWTALLIGTLAACTNIQNNRDHTPTDGAQTGAPAGAPGGGANGNAADKKKGGNATKESALDTQLAGLRQQIADRREYNESLRAQVAAKEKQLETVLASDRSAGPTVQEFDLRTSVYTKTAEIDRQARSWQETIDAHTAVLKKAGDDPHAADLQNEIDQLTEQRAELLRQRERLVAINSKLKP